MTELATGASGGDPVVAVPAHERRLTSWRQTVRGGPKADRMLREVEVRLPPHIASVETTVPSTLRAVADDALREIVSLDHEHGDHLASLSVLLLRAESVASSKIERIQASIDDYAKALHGVNSNASAVSMVASTKALDSLIRTVDGGSPLTWANVLTAHRVLMRDDPHEANYAGRVRDQQNWIGGSDHSPRDAWYVPPPSETVPDYVEDLVTYANRDDIGIMEQSAILHAQFESIHPFTDGNGRIGRALINTLFRRRGITRRLVVPLASAVVARREAYFDALTAYRDGDAGPLTASFARGSAIAASESRTTAHRLSELPEEWRDLAGRPRRGSASSAILDLLLVEPIFTAEEMHDRVGGATSRVYAAIERLHESGIIRPLTNRTRNQVWVAVSVADELEDLGSRIELRARSES